MRPAGFSVLLGFFASGEGRQVVLDKGVLTTVKNSDTVTTAPGPFGRFYLQERINGGGMADIWLATNSDNKAFALRLMHERLRFNLLARHRFFRGCDILSKIHDHSGIIGYIEHGTIKARPYCLMEYVEAANLKEVYARQDPVLVENVAQI